MEEIILNFSNQALKERKKVSYLTMIMLPIMVTVFAYIFMKVKVHGDIDLKLFGTILCVVVFLLLIEMFVVYRVMFKKIREMKLIVSESTIKRVGGKFEETIPYEEIKKVSVKRDSTNRILYLKIKYSRKNINLSGFDDMDYLLSKITSNQREDSQIIEVKNKVNWNSPMVSFITMVILVLAISLLILLKLDVYEMFRLFIPVVLGFFFLITKPISKNGGARFRVLEVSLSCIMIICGLLNLILQ